jgi:cytoskeleton protein RodZ
VSRTSLGSHLRSLRQHRGASLDEVVRLTRVAPRYLEALEADDLASLPAPVFVRGFIRAYCQALGEPAEAALALYHEQAGVPPPPAGRRPLSASAPRRDPARSTVLVSFVLLVVLGLALFGVTLALQSGRELAARRPEPPPTPAVPEAARPEPPASAAAESPREPAPAAPGAVAAAAPAPVEPAEPPAAASARAVPSPAPAAPGEAPAVGPAPEPPLTPSRLATALGPVTAPYRLVARAVEPTWVRVRTEDGRLIEETIPAGQSREWVSDRPFTLTIGNAGGVSLELNGRALPALGARGAVVPRLVLPPAEP